MVSKLIAENFDFSVRSCAINADWSSLNSLNGTVEAEDGRHFFFKFHQEEGEEATVQEYYRAELLQRAGLPVDVPAMVCRKPGHQILLYAFRRDRTLADFCLQMERTGDLRELEAVVQLQARVGSRHRRELRRLAQAFQAGAFSGRTGASTFSQSVGDAAQY